MGDVSMTLVPVEQGRRRILESIQPLAPIDLPLAEVHGCVIATDVVAEYDIPQFSSAGTDGFACRAADIVGATAEAPVPLRVVGWALSGRAPDATVGWGEAVRVATGAPMPAGSDSVVPPGAFEVVGETVNVRQAVQAGTHVNPAGLDVRAGSLLVPAGRRLSAAELGILAAAGHGTALSYPHVRVAVVAIGPSLVEPGRPAGFGQVRDAVSYALLGALRDAGAVPYRIGIVEDMEAELRETLSSAVLRSDAFICSGGIVDDDDQLGVLLAGIGEVDAHRVAMVPGGTFGFGLLEGKPLFSLSGEPLSALASFEAFVRPAVLKLMGRRDLARPEVGAVLDESVGGPSGVTRFVPVRAEHRGGAWHASPTGTPDPSRLGGLVQANGLAVIPADRDAVSAGERVRVQILRPLER